MGVVFCAIHGIGQQNRRFMRAGRTESCANNLSVPPPYPRPGTEEANGPAETNRHRKASARDGGQKQFTERRIAQQRRITQRRADLGNPASHPPLKNRIGSTPDGTGASPGCLQKCLGVAVTWESGRMGRCVKILSQTKPGFGVDAVVVFEKINVVSDWCADGMTTEPTTWWIGKSPATASRGG